MNENSKSIKISDDLIRLLGRKLYSSQTHVIVLRELIQNAIDACHNKGKVNVEYCSIGGYNNENIVISVNDTGCGMSEQVLTDVFLSIGSSLKLSNNSIGGFGIAKVSIFACDNWKVNTTCGMIDNKLELDKTGRTKAGTMVSVSVKERFDNHAIRIMSYFNNTALLTINKERIKPYNGKMIDYVQFDNGINAYVSIGKSYKGIFNQIIYRSNGLVQFYSYLYDDIGANIIVDFTGIGYKPSSDDYPFTMSRESITNQYANKIMDVIRKYTTEVLSLRTRVDKSKSKNKIIRGINFSYSNCTLQEINTLINRRLAELFSELCKIACSKQYDFIPGVMDEHDTIAKINSDNKEVYINPDSIKGMYKTLPGLIVALYHTALHEVSHLENESHNEDFTSYEGYLARLSSDDFMAQLPKIIKKYKLLESILIKG